MKKILIYFFVVTCALFTACSKSSQNDKIKVGVLMPLTGDIAYIGQSYVNAMMMGIDEDKVELIIDDTKSDVKTAISALNKMLSFDKIDVVVSAVPAVSEGINPILESKGILHYALTFSPEISQKENVIKLFPSSDEEVRAYMNYAVEKELHNVVFLRHMFPDAELAFKTVVKPESKLLGLNVTDIPFDLSTRDFNNLANKVKVLQPELVIVQSLSYNFYNISKSFMHAGILDKMLGDLNFGDLYSCYALEEANELNGIPFLGLTYVTSERYNDFKKSYIEKYGEEPHYLSAFLYDVTITLNHLNLSGITKNEIIRYYNMNKLKGVTSDIIRLDSNGDQIVGYSVLTFKNGEYEIIQ